VLALVPALGGRLGRVTVVGCEPASLADGIGLTDLVASRVPDAGRLVLGLVAKAADSAERGFTSVHGQGTVRR
jgi:hydrogenase maturation protease